MSQTATLRPPLGFALPAALPVARLVVGQTAAAAAALLPRIFSLCAVAQGTAARLAFGLPLADDTPAAMAGEALREHVLRLTVTWPALARGTPEPQALRLSGDALRAALFGDGRLPETLAELRRATDGIALATLGALDTAFPAGTAVATAADDPCIVIRHPHHPLLGDIAARCGRGPLWRAAARAVEAEAILDGWTPAFDLSDGTARVDAARGRYTVRATVVQGRVTAFARRTPTDALCAEGGVLAQTLATLHDAALAPLALAILDPCVPVTLTGGDADA
ncbi:hypothetical protein DXV76_13335 [Rhodobacteraceae bacterium CCMM004]|nr:hypothetical protein DXV76_13335 [Rhodobacteraceae bacterium CCMM004]